MPTKRSPTRRRSPDGPQIPGLLVVYDKHGAVDLSRVDMDVWEEYKNRRLFRLGSAGYAGTTRDRKLLYLHRVILGLEGTRIHVDHINRDPLDNRRHNLRVATHSENQINRGGAGFEKCWSRQQDQNALWEAA